MICYAQEGARREGHRRVDNGTQVKAVATLATACKPSVDFDEYWQRAQRKLDYIGAVSVGIRK